MDDLPDVCLSAVLERAAARPRAPPAWAAIVRVSRRWRRRARAAITEVSLRDRASGSGSPWRPGGSAMLGPALVAAFPSSTRPSLDFSYGRGHRHAPELGLLSDITTLTDLRVRLAGAHYIDGDLVAISALSNIVQALALHDTRLDLPLAEIAGFKALESLSMTY
eukprot:SM000010S04366  [mRNA]  locus=s10:1093455:1093975:+ [translate_table: standard]